ncbi:uncharacterized protein RAG0_03732 [Rhynchosporium agropyri]|uniref:Uncharacterized protein n=1 Tax=Rhynchosporium agropyri TaxID=914238 RepID=A0A1E1K5P3_9HELO|nr:uncharacterized protein RAG0_03732 [Rhynchosporium agropyri]
MAPRYETIPVFDDTWIECRGNLGQFRMAIENDDIRARDFWRRVTRNWYSTAYGRVLQLVLSESFIHLPDTLHVDPYYAPKKPKISVTNAQTHPLASLRRPSKKTSVFYALEKDISVTKYMNSSVWR